VGVSVGERLAMALDSPLLKGVDAENRIDYPPDGLSSGELATLEIAQHLQTVDSQAGRLDPYLRSVLAVELRSLADRMEGYREAGAAPWM
jgi:hypothetical protein